MAFNMKILAKRGLFTAEVKPNLKPKSHRDFNRYLTLQSAQRGFASSLKLKVEQKIVEKTKALNILKKEHANFNLGEIQASQVIGGMRGMTGLLYETSKLHHIQGIRYRGKDLYEIRDNAPKAPGGSEPLPEGVLWLLLTTEFPTEKELSEFKEELYKRGRIPDEVEQLIRNFPKDMHPMTQFSMGIMAC